MTSCILDLMDLTEEDELEALGEDRVAVVQGRRRSALRYFRKESLESQNDGRREPSGHSSVWGSGCIPSGGGKWKLQQRSLVTYQDTASQTNRPFRGLLLPESLNEKDNITILCQARDIQLSVPIYLADAARPGAWFTREGKLTQTSLQLTGPDLLPFTAAIDALEDAEQEIPEIKLNLWAPHRIRNQGKEKRDGEWLEMESKEDSDAENVNERSLVGGPGDGSAKTTNHYCDELMKSLRPLFLIMKFGGRWPITSQVNVDSTSCHFNLHSWQFLAFLLTSFTHFYITAISIHHTGSFLYSGESEESEYKPPVYQQIQRLEFDKYWHYVFWTYITATFVCIWNVILLIDGTSIQDLLNRWTLAVTKMKYEPTEDIQFLTIIYSSIFILYAIALTICLITDAVPAVRGFSGVIGSLFFSSAFTKIRFSRYFLLVRVFGLCFHLYTVYAAEVAMLFVITCTRLIENSASIWNIRFALRFQTSRRAPPYQVTSYRAGIPMVNLLMEHQIITTFSRHTANVLHATLNVYLVTKGTEMVLFMYRSLAFLLIPHQVQFNETHIQGKIGESGDIVVYKDSEAQQHLTCFVLTAIVIASWFNTSICIVKCGEVILFGTRYVTRYGLIVCKSAKERLFIQSINMQFGPVLEYTMKASFYYNRRTVLQFFLWVLIFAIGLLSFNPFNLQKHPIRVCTPGFVPLDPTTCLSIQANRFQLHASGNLKDPRKDLISPTPPSPCNTDWFQVEVKSRIPTSTVVPTTVLTSELVACDRNGKPVDPYTKGYCSEGATVAPYANSPPRALFDCQSPTSSANTELDNCGNIRLGAGTKKFVELIFQSSATTVVITCASCYDYAQFGQKNTESLKYCHMQSLGQAAIVCGQNGAPRSGNIRPLLPNSLGVKCIPKEDKSIITCEVDPQWRNLQEGGGTGPTPVRHIRIIKACRSGTANEVNPFDPQHRFGSCFQATASSDQNTARPYGYLIPPLLLQSCTLNPGTAFDPLPTRDSCGNWPHVSKVSKRNPMIRLRGIVLEMTNGDFWLVCCYDYYFMEGNEESIKFCHMNSLRQAEEACAPARAGTDKKRLQMLLDPKNSKPVC